MKALEESAPKAVREKICKDYYYITSRELRLKEITNRNKKTWQWISVNRSYEIQKMNIKPKATREICAGKMKAVVKEWTTLGIKRCSSSCTSPLTEIIFKYIDAIMLN